MTNRVQNAIDIFLDAINKGTLAKGTCVACAVGNLVASGMGAKIYINGFDEANIPVFNCNINNHTWNVVFMTSLGYQEQNFELLNSKSSYVKEIKKLMDSTGFTPEELAKIEFAFETNTRIKIYYYNKYSKEAIREDQINGLKAVVEVMMTFDDIKEDVDEVFTKKAELIPV